MKKLKKKSLRNKTYVAVNENDDDEADEEETDDNDIYNDFEIGTLNGHHHKPQVQQQLQPQLLNKIKNTHDTSIISLSSATSPTPSSNCAESHSGSGSGSASNSHSNHSNRSSPRSDHEKVIPKKRESPQIYSPVQRIPLTSFSHDYDDGDEICLVPEVEFEGSMFDNGSDNRESQPLLGCTTGNNGRDHVDLAFNTFGGTFNHIFLSFF